MTADTTLRGRIAAALLARIKQAVIQPGTPLFGGGMQHVMAANEYDLADVVLPIIAAERAVAISETVHDHGGAHPPLHRWRAELLDGGEWVPASGLKTDREDALAQLRAGERTRPWWPNGTPVQRRLIRETTTYTVEDLDADATGEQA